MELVGHAKTMVPGNYFHGLLPEEIVEKIFAPFFTTKEPGKGTGVGLSITYNLVKEFKGDIAVESEEGAGTTFRTIFPMHLEREDAIDDEL